MTPDQVKSSYQRALRGHVTVRRYTSTGTNRTKVDVPNVRARVVAYQSAELVGTIVQGDSRAVLYADDVASLTKLTTNDKVIVNGREMSIITADDKSRRVDDVLIAYELQLRG